VHIIAFFDSVGRDLRFALRGLSRRPAFTFAAVLTLALGIGATTAIFSVVYSVLIKPLPYPNAGELVRIRHASSGFGDINGSEPSMYFAYRNETRTLTRIGLWLESSATLTDRGDPERVRALLVTDGTLQALGVQPSRGRGSRSRNTDPRPRVRCPSFCLTLSGNGDSAATTRRSGASSRSRRRPAAALCLWLGRRRWSASWRPVSGSST
jgi:hypothetical protein